MSTPERIVRAARRLRLLTYGAILLLAIAVGAGLWILFGGRIDAALNVSLDAGGLTGPAAAFVLLAAAGLVAAALFQLAAMLRTIEQGEPFAAAARLRRFALFLFLAVLGSILLPPLLGLAVTGGFSLSLGSGEVLMLFVTGLLFFVARLLDEAQRVAEEHRQIV